MKQLLKSFLVASVATSWIGLAAAPVTAQENAPEILPDQNPFPSEGPVTNLPSGGEGDAERIAELMERLRGAEPEDARIAERELRLIWSRSGSPAMDLLLRRGRDALEAGDVDTAIGHLSALIDHAPDFAEGYHARAQAFYAAEEFGLAISDLEQAIALNPDHFGAAFGLASILEQVGMEDAAFAGYEAVLKVDPTHEQAQQGYDRLVRAVGGKDI